MVKIMHMKRPIIIQENEGSTSELETLRRNHVIWEEIDVYRLQLIELFEISNPKLVGTDEYNAALNHFLRKQTMNQDSGLKGAWVYFPWSKKLVHMLGDKDYYSVRTNRNRNLITSDEQKKIRDFNVAMVGLSVGSNIATALAYGGLSKYITLCEFDTLETSNLNRIRARVDQIGMPKVEVVAQQIYEIDPFAQISIQNTSLTLEKLQNFVDATHKPQLIFEVIDSFEMKIHLRRLARERGIPVIMVTNLGDRVLIDLERYDLDPDNTFFNGRAGKVPEEIIQNPDISDELKNQYAVDLAGVQNIPKRAMESVAQIGNTLVGRPQLATTVTVAGGFCAYLTKKIALGDKTVHGSWLVDFDKVFKAENTL